MKKIFAGFLTMAFCTLQMPALAVDVGDWSSLDTQVQAGASDIQLTAGIISEGTISNSAATTVIDAAGYFISGDNASPLFINGGTLSISNGILQNGNGVNGAAVQNNGGTLTLNNVNFVNNAVYGSGGAIYSFQGVVNINASGADVVYSGNTQQVGEPNDIFLDFGTIVNLSAVDGSITLDGGIQGDGVVNKAGAGTLNLGGSSSNFSGTFNQTEGTTNVSDKFFGGESNISGGIVNLQSGGSLVNGSSMSLFSSGNIINIENGSSMEVGSSIVLSPETVANINTTTAGGAYDFNAMMSGSGDINKTANGTVNFTQDESVFNGQYSQAAGTSNVSNNFFLGTNKINGGTLNLEDGFSLQGGTINLGGGAVLNINASAVGEHYYNAATKGTGTINKTNDGTVGFYADNSEFAGTYNQSGGKANVYNNFFGGTNNFSGGDVEVAASGNLTIDSADSWSGTNILNSGGNVYLEDVTHTSGGSYSQTGGYSNFGDSIVTLNDGSNLDGGELYFEGNLNLSNTVDKSIGTQLYSDHGVINKDNSGTTTFSGYNAGFLGTYNQTAGKSVIVSDFYGGTKNFTGGEVEIQSGGNLVLKSTESQTDTWTDANILNSGGALTLEGITHTSGGSYSQTDSNGWLSMDAASELTVRDTSNIDSGYIFLDGILNLSSTIDKTIGAAISGSGAINKIGSNVTTFTNDNSGFSGTYSQAGGTTNANSSFFSGTSDINGGTLNFNENALHLSGQINLSGAGTVFNLNDGSTLLGGTVNLGDDTVLNINATSDYSYYTYYDNTIGTGTINKDHDGNVNFAGDNSGFIGVYNQTAGTSTVSSNFFAGKNNISGGTLNLEDGFSLSGGTLALGDDAVLNINTTSAYGEHYYNAATTGTGTINKTNDGTVGFYADNSGFKGTYNQSGGLAAIYGKFFTGTNNLYNGEVDVSTGGELALKATDSWTGANILNCGGSISLEGVVHTSGGWYSQGAGHLTIDGTSTLTIDDDDNLDGGSLSVNGILNLSGDTINKIIATAIDGDGIINKTGYTAVDVTADNSGFTGVYNSTGGNTNISNKFFGGTTNATDSYFVLQANGNLVGGSTLNLMGGNNILLVEDGSSMDVGSNINVASSSQLFFHPTSASDEYDFNAKVAGEGMFFKDYDSITNFTADNSGFTGQFFQSGGASNVSGKFFSGINYIDGGILNLLEGGSLVAGSSTGLSVSGTTLNIEDKSLLELGSNISADADTVININTTDVANLYYGANTSGIVGAVINKDGNGTVEFAGDNSFFAGTFNQNLGKSVITGNFFEGKNNFYNGDVEVAPNGNLIIKSSDNWTGANILNSGGTISLNGVTHESGGTYSQTLGETYLDGDSVLTIGDGSVLEGGNLYVDGTLNLSMADSIAINTCFVNNGIINKDGSANLTFLQDNSSFAGTYNQTAGTATILNNFFNGANHFSAGEVEHMGGNLGFNSDDTWTNTNITNTGGTITLDEFTHDTSAGGTYNQFAAGGLEFGNNSSLILGSGSSITDGSVNFTGTGSSLTLLEDSQLDGFVTLNLASGNDLNIQGGGHAINGDGTGPDVWLGNVNMSGGTLFIDSFTSNGALNQTGGDLYLSSGELTLGDDSNLDGGNFIANGILNLSSTVDKTIGTTFSSGGAGIINKTGTATVNFTADNSGFVATYRQEDGTTNFSNKTFSGGMEINGGTLNLNRDSVLVNTQIDLSKTSAAETVLNIQDGSALQSDSYITVAADTTMNINTTSAAVYDFNSTVNGGTGTINKVGNGVVNFTSDNSDFAGTYNQEAGTANVISTFFSGESYIKNGSTLNIQNLGFLNTGASVVLSDAGTVMNLENGSAMDTPNISVGAGTNLNINATSGTQYGYNAITSGLGTINKNYGGDVVFSDNNSAFTGTYNQTAGTSTVWSNFFGGESNIQSGSTLTLQENGNLVNMSVVKLLGAGTTMNIEDGATTEAGSAIEVAAGTALNINYTIDSDFNSLLTGTGIINKNNAITLTFTDECSGFSGTYNQNGGSTIFLKSAFNTGMDINLNGSDADHTADLDVVYSENTPYTGQVNLIANSVYTLSTDGNIVTNTSNDLITGVVGQNNNLVVEGGGAYRVELPAERADFNYRLEVKDGSMSVDSDSANFNDAVAVGTGPSNPRATLTVASDEVQFHNGLVLSNALFNVVNNGFDVTSGGLTVGSTVNTMNGVIATNNITGDLTVGTSGVSNYMIDIAPRTLTSDKYAITGNIAKTAIGDSINIQDFQFVGAAPVDRNINLKIFDATGNVDSGILFTQTDKRIATPIGEYGLFSQGNGAYSLSLTNYNPQVFRGQVATVASYANQLTTNGVIFDHINLVSEQLMSQDKPNVYASDNPLYAPYQYNKQDGGLWYKAYGNLERLQLTQDINTQNNMWGSLIGADFPIVSLKNGWKMLPTAYVGYTGGYQAYNNVTIHQNGGQGGLMGTFYKGDFITSLLANVGGYGNDMSAGGSSDSTGNWFAGVSSKSSYNVKLPKDFILQPNLLMSYNAFGAQNWNSGFGSMNMTTNMLNGLNLAPGLNLILNKKTWSIYATTQLMFNLMNGASGTAGNVDLPTVKMGSTYFQYGLGVTKRIKDRLSLYGQIVMSNGVRTGVGFQGGVQWKF